MISAPMELESRLSPPPAPPSPEDHSDAQFRLLVDSVTDYAIYLLDRAGRVTSWNPGAQRIKGYAAIEVIGRHFSLFYPPEERAAGRPEEMLSRAERDGRASGQGWRVRKDGTRFWADVVITALRTPGGHLAGFAKLTRDMTASRLAAERLQESEALLRGFTEHSAALMFLKDLDGRYGFVNQRFLREFHLTREQVLGRTDAELFPPAVAASFAASDARVVAERAPVQLEEVLPRFDGERIQITVKFPVFDVEGRLAGVGGVATDITERKRTEQALAEQRALLDQAQKLARLGSWEWDPVANRISWSDELYRIYGERPGLFRPSFEAYLERVHPDDREATARVLERALATGEGFTHEERIVRADGGVRTLRTHGEVVREAGGGVAKLVGACLDITEQRESDIAMRVAAASLQALTRRLVEAEEAERRRIAGELHDRVGQNLSALNINLDIVLAGLGSEAPPAHASRLRDSLALVEATLQAIENLMAELRPPLLEEYGLGAALGWYAQEFSQRTGLEVRLDDHAREHNRRLRREAGVALFRIAQEALANVARHAGAGRAELSLAASDGQVELVVSDDGRGFEPNEVGATRWGMKTMKERAMAAGGSLEVVSAPGKGTTLRARVPL